MSLSLSSPVPEDTATVNAHIANNLSRFRSLQEQLVQHLHQLQHVRKSERTSSENGMTDAAASTPTATTSFNTLTRDISLIFLELRSLSRKLVANDSKYRSLVENAKIQCDHSRLDLESLTYELNYFQDELNYKSNSLELIKARQLQEAKLIDEDVFKKEC